MRYIPSTKWFLPIFVVAALSLTAKKAFEDKKRETGSRNIPVFNNSEDAWAKNALTQLSLEEKIAQFFMVASWPNRNESHQAEIEALVRDQKIGGIIYFQGDRQSLATSVKRMQAAAKTPLLIGIDAEWGLAMRLNGEERYPYAYTVGTANDSSLTRKMAQLMAEDCRELGIHLNFAPVADVNSNPSNPVIGFRSFGQEPATVAAQVMAFVKGMETEGVMTSIKHFPGHGDTDVDSHLDLPKLSHSREQLSSREWVPFRAGIKAGTSTVMIGHLDVPALDGSGTPASLSSKVIRNYLRDSLHFNGLVVSDALNMKAVADRYGKTDVVVKAFEAGNDILLFPEDVQEAIKQIAARVKSGKISEKEINERCLHILQHKAHVLAAAKKPISSTVHDRKLVKRQLFEKALTMIRNNGVFPLTDGNRRIALVRIGVHTYATDDAAAEFDDADSYHFYTFEEAAKRMHGKLDRYDIVLTTVHPKSVLAANQFSMPGKLDNWLAVLPANTKHGLIHFGNPGGLAQLSAESRVDALLLAWENHPLAQEAAIQAVFGAIPVTGRMPVQVSDWISLGKGETSKAAGRLKFSQPEAIGLQTSDFDAIQQIVESGINAKAFPGCQVLVAVEGNIIYRKAFGSVTYEDSTPITNQHVYDIASVSKIVGSTAALMRLQTKDQFSLDKKVKDYLPELTSGSAVAEINLRKMMAHQAGFTPWLAFYKETVKNGKPDASVYASARQDGFEIPVADKLWIRNDYPKIIYDRILSSPLKANPGYEYSDLGYYFAKKIIEKQSGVSLDQFMYQELYDPMGLRNIRYLPQMYFPLKRIVPTENDTEFRGQVIRGFVHDPGAAMMGGVGGHAGIFSNATDLAAMMQLFLNKGYYCGKQLIDPQVIAEYTKAQFPGNRRGAGFDRPNKNRSEGMPCELVSYESYGHSGFTGTFVWADPVYNINFVFLSNRVYPNAANKKLSEMNIRTKIHRVIYEAVIKAKGKKGE